MSFLGELKRRKIFQVAAVYAVVAWLLVQIVATIEAPLNLPDWVDTLVIVLLAVGFPITLIVSWGFNLTPEGLVREEASPGTLQKRGSKIEYALIGLLIVAMLWVLYRVEFQRPQPVVEHAVPTETSPTAVPAESRPDVLPDSVAVLPFANLSPDPDNAYFAAGVHEEILNQLAQIGTLNVIARTSVLQYANDPPPIPDIARELKVETVMEGSVRYAGDTVRVTAQLIDGNSGAHLWTEAYDGDLSDVFGIQTDVASKIAASLEAELLPETRARLEKPLTDSPAAYAFFLQAKDQINNGSFPEAISLLDRAIELDPEFAAAYAYRAWRGAWTLVNTTFAATNDPTTLRMLEERAIDDASQALARDENLGHAWLARATLSRVSFHWKTAEEGFSRALALAPNDSDVLGDYGNFKAEIGECDDAMMLSQRNVEINPNGVLPYAWLVITAHKCHEYEVALEAAERLGELMPGSPFAFNTIGLAHIPLGNSVEAARYLRTAEQLATDDFVILLAGQIYAYGLLGLDDDARRVYERFLPLTDKIDVGAGEWIFTYLGIGDIDSAHEWLERALTKVENGERDAGYISFMIAVRNVHNDPILEQPRFRELFDKIEAIARSR
jgi:TolB-like protein